MAFRIALAAFVLANAAYQFKRLYFETPRPPQRNDWVPRWLPPAVGVVAGVMIFVSAFIG